MPNKTISQLTANPGIDGTEVFPIEKGGASYKEDYDTFLSWIISSSFVTTPLTVDVATTAALSGSWIYDNGTAGVGATLTRTTNGALGNIDGVSAVVGRTYLIKNFTGGNRKFNGPYTLTTVGSAGAATVFTRLPAGDESADLDGQVIIPSQGSTNARRVFSQTTANPTVGTSNIVYVVASAGGGNIRSDGTVDFTATETWDDGGAVVTTVSPTGVEVSDGAPEPIVEVSTIGVRITDGTDEKVLIDTNGIKANNHIGGLYTHPNSQATPADFALINNVKVLRGLITQTSTNNPVLTIKENTTGETVSTNYNEGGLYSITLTGSVLDATKNLVRIEQPGKTGPEDGTVYASAMIVDADTIRICTWSLDGDAAAVAADGALSNTAFELLMYQ